MHSYNSSLERVLGFFLDSDPNEFPESEAEYMTKRREYVGNIDRECCLRIFRDNKLTNTGKKKVFLVNTNETRSYQESIKKMHDAVSQTPLNEKCLIIENTKRDVD